MHSPTGCICLTFLHCVFLNECSNGLRLRIHTYIDSICWVLLHCAFSNVSSNFLPERRQNHSGCICLTFLHCVFSNESSNGLPVRMQSRIGCMCMTFLQCASQVSPQTTSHCSHSWHLFVFSPLCVAKCVLKTSPREEAKPHW